ncbi:MAG: nitronate monooxygenase [Gammaproteobacteria bacterium]|nr:nitronate monooxygenase [Gammaproteobacteria bacterium]
MKLKTRLTDLLELEHPIVLAPMARVAGGRLAAAVSDAGGLGLIGGGYCEPEWIGAEFDEAGEADVGIGFITWRLDQAPGILDLALERRPRAVLLSFGDIAPYAERIKSAGSVLIAQIQTLAQAVAARAAGADVIVAQGAEAGGHAGHRSTLPLVPAVVDRVAPVPVIAAGGIGEGRGVAAALVLGAAGAMLGSRFYTCREALAHANAKQRAIEAGGDDTVRSRVFDRLRRWNWPAGYALRTLANDMTRRWTDDPGALADEFEREINAFDAAIEVGDMRIAPVIIGEAADLIGDLRGAGELVHSLVDDAAARLEAAADVLQS